MDQIIKLMKERAIILRKAIEKANREREPYPDGHLRITTSNDKPRYYLITKRGDTNGKYITRENRSIIPQLAKKDYNQQFLTEATKELERLEQAIAWFSISNADLSYQKLSDKRQDLISPYIMTDKLYAKTWQSQKIKPCSYMPDKLVYETKRGEMVRSKSEALIANTLYDLKLPYFYEKSLQLKNGIVRYPDFTILHTKKREEFYLEHFGLLDDEAYLYNNLHKLDEYRENGIFLGKNLLITYETTESPLDIRGIKGMLRNIFLADK